MVSRFIACSIGLAALSSAIAVSQAADAPAAAMPTPPPLAVKPAAASGANTATANTASKPSATAPAEDTRMLNEPRGVAIDSKGVLYVADVGDSVVYKVTQDGTATIFSDGTNPNATVANAPNAEPGFAGVSGVALDKDGNLYVADADNNMIRKITPAGVVSTIGGKKDPDTFHGPTAVAVDTKGNVFVADTHGAAVIEIASDGKTSVLAGAPGSVYDSPVDGKGAAAGFGAPRAIAVDGAGVVYVADEQFNDVRKIMPDGTVTTLAGDPKSTDGKDVDGVGTKAVFTTPRGIAVDAKGNVYVADTDGNDVRKIAPDGTVTTFVGKANAAGYADGKGDVARFASPRGLAMDKDGNLFVADSGNGLIRKVTPDGTVTTIKKPDAPKTTAAK